jgi:iron complex outermembrane receptor protein
MPALTCALACAPLLLAPAAQARTSASQSEVVVTARPTAPPRSTNSTATVDAAAIRATINAMTVEDTLKYLPSLVVRKRNIGDTQAPLATRTSGLGSSARALVYADGVLLSALIGNNNANAAPRWGLVAPSEIARIDVIYGPFSARHPGNAIGAVVDMTTRMPRAPEAEATAATSVQRFRQYGTDLTLPAYRFAATLGGRVGPLSLFTAFDRVRSDSQPLTYVTALRPAAAAGGSDTPATGGFEARDRTGRPILVLGASGIERQDQQRLKLKAALDLAPGLTLTYLGALFRNDTDADAQSYLRDAAGRPVFAGTLGIGGRAFPVAPNAFSNGVYRFEQRHSTHALTLRGEGERVDWRLTATDFAFDRDRQRIPGTALPAARAGGAGVIARLDGTGWRTLDGVADWRLGRAHQVGLGAHLDAFRLVNDRFATPDWMAGSAGALVQRSAGRTRTAALWAEDRWTIAPGVTLTPGVRQEWWRASAGENFSTAPPLSVRRPIRAAARFSSKLALAWEPDGAWRLRASFGQAWRFPTVSELYQVVTTPVPAVPDPDLRPERARSVELAAEWRDPRGGARLALFGEGIRDALISQLGPLNGTTTLATFVQNVGRTRARGVEFVLERRDLVPRFDLSGSVTHADAETRRNRAFPASVGRQLPSVPRWKATAVATWRPVPGIALTAAGRYAGRNYGTLDNSDVVGDTFGGFHRYFVADLRAAFDVGDRLTLGLGVDNIGDDRYFLFHPFPQRTFHLDLRLRR